MKKTRIITDTPEKSEIEYQRAWKGKRKYSGKTLEKKKTLKKSLIMVDSSENEHQEIPYAELSSDVYLEVSGKKKKLQMLQNKVLQLVMMQKGILF